jgi:hypothetical protein
LPITYNPSTNIITDNNVNTEATADDFDDLYTADKAGSLQLLAPTASALDLSLSTQVRSADDKALKLNIIITGFSAAGDITLTGQDKDGNAQTEIISITANGTYVSTKWFKSIDANGVDCTGTYTIEVTQSRWGVVWKAGTTQFMFDCRIIIGDGSTTTWFVDTEKQVCFSATAITVADQYLVTLMNYAYLRFGILDDAATRRTSRGIHLIDLHSTYNHGLIKQSSTATTQSLYIYSSAFEAKVLADVELRQNVKFYNNLVGQAVAISIRTTSTTMEIYNIIKEKLTSESAPHFGFYVSPTYVDKITVTGMGRVIYAGGTNSYIVKNVYARQYTYLFRPYSWTGNAYLVNFDVDNWNFLWYNSPDGKVYRQYEFDLTVTDKDNNPISGATVTLKDKDGNTVFTATTDTNGNIATQTVSRGYYQQSTGNTLNEYSPHTLTIEKAGYQIYIKGFTLAEKTKWEIKLTKIVDIILVDGKPALNLSETDPDNELYAVM